MKQLLLGTANPAKITRLRAYLAGLPLEMLQPDELSIHIQVEENGRTPVANATAKANAYYRQAGIPTLAIDAALHIQGLPDSQQPGVYVRRIGKSNRPASDRELLAHYSKAIRRLGGLTRARWRLGLALVLSTGELVHKSFPLETLFSSTPSKTIIPGEPLSSMLLDTKFGRYFSEWDNRQRPDGFIIRDFVAHNLQL